MLDLSKILGLSKKKKRGGTSITSISISYLGDKHGLDGMEVQESVFELKIPFQNKTGSDLLADNLKRPDLRVEVIGVSAPFELVEVDPKLPIAMKYKDSVEIKLKIKAPNLPYTGPLNISVGEKASSIVRIQIEKIVGISGKRRVDLEEEPSVLSVQKEQVLKRDVQLYKIMKYGDKINRIEVNAPFVLSGSDPKTPFAIDKQNSYTVSVYLLAPNYGYAGPLEITFF